MVTPCHPPPPPPSLLYRDGWFLSPLKSALPHKSYSKRNSICSNNHTWILEINIVNEDAWRTNKLQNTPFFLIMTTS